MRTLSTKEISPTWYEVSGVIARLSRDAIEKQVNSFVFWKVRDEELDSLFFLIDARIKYLIPDQIDENPKN
jgi:hypothetical protein